LLLLIILAVAAYVIYRARPKEEIIEVIEVEPPPGAQLLIFPMRNGWITGGYRNQQYVINNGYPHYGLDIAPYSGGCGEVIASGEGIVLGTEYCPNSVGNIAVIRYDGVFLPESGEVAPLIARYYHMTGLTIARDDRVSAGQVIGAVDGSHQWYHHIHIELDRDVGHPFNTPQVAEATSELLIRFPANGDGTVEPVSVLALCKSQKLYRHPNADSCTEKDKPTYGIKQ
jgi:hypothetical protein